MMRHDDASVLTATLEAYTEAANGKRADDFGKTVFPSKEFLATEPLCEFGGGLCADIGQINIPFFMMLYISGYADP